MSSAELIFRRFIEMNSSIGVRNAIKLINYETSEGVSYPGTLARMHSGRHLSRQAITQGDFLSAKIKQRNSLYKFRGITNSPMEIQLS